MVEKPGDVLTIDELSGYLKIPKSTLYKLVREGKVHHGQESNPTTWKLAMMNLAFRGIDVNLGGQNADSFHKDLHKDLRADFILANPPFNMSDWGGESHCHGACGACAYPSIQGGQR